MKKVVELFASDIKREFTVNTTVDCMIRTFDIDKYVITPHIETILGNFLTCFFDAQKYTSLKAKCQLLQTKYSEKVGPALLIGGAWGTGKSHMLKIIYTLFTLNSIDYIDQSGNALSLDVISTLQNKFSDKNLAELIKNIKPFDYITLIFSAGHFTKSKETLFDYLVKTIAKENCLPIIDDKKYSLTETADFVNNTLHHFDKKRMIIFIDDISEILDTDDKGNEFNKLLELLDNDIWFIVTVNDSQSGINGVTTKALSGRFSNKQMLLKEDRECVVKRRFLVKREEAGSAIAKLVNVDKLQSVFDRLPLSNSTREKNVVQDIIAYYPFYPCQIAYVKEILKYTNSDINLIETIKEIMINPEVCDKEIGYFVDIELIYEKLRSVSSIRQFDNLISSLEEADENNTPIDKQTVIKILKVIVFLAHVIPGGVSAEQVVPFASSPGISDADKLHNVLDFLAYKDLIGCEGSLYGPIVNGETFIREKEVKKESEFSSNISDDREEATSLSINSVADLDKASQAIAGNIAQDIQTVIAVQEGQEKVSSFVTNALAGNLPIVSTKHEADESAVESFSDAVRMDNLLDNGQESLQEAIDTSLDSGRFGEGRIMLQLEEDSGGKELLPLRHAYAAEADSAQAVTDLHLDSGRFGEGRIMLPLEEEAASEELLPLRHAVTVEAEPLEEEEEPIIATTEIDKLSIAIEQSELLNTADSIKKPADTESLELLNKLEEIFGKIEKEIEQDLKEGKKITLESYEITNSARSCYSINLKKVSR